MQRRSFQRNGLTLSYLDTGDDGRPLVALHAHWKEGQTYAALAAGLAPEWNAVLLGNSLGGVNAYQFAARHPRRILGMVIEDIGVEIADDTSFALSWGGIFETREAFVERVGPRMLPYLQDSIRETPVWKLAFDPREGRRNTHSMEITVQTGWRANVRDCFCAASRVESQNKLTLKKWLRGELIRNWRH